MALTPPSPVRVTEVVQITPPPDSTESPAESTLPLTFFDTLWFKFHPVERIFFYQLTGAASAEDSSFFYSSILPKLKHSLSLTLLHFRPLAGNLIWPSDSPKPYILYNNFSDGVSLTVAKSDADFRILSGDTIRDAADSYHYIPELSVSETKASIVSFQITLFPDKGFSIGVSSHHAITDGKSIIMFLKAWAHISRHEDSLPAELTPVFDRNIIQDPEGICMVNLNNWITLASKMGSDSNPKSLKLLPISTPSDIRLVRGTFRLSGEDLKKLRQKVISAVGEGKLSTFLLTYAYVAFNIVKSKGLEGHVKLALGFMADCRSRLNFPVPENYFGNCVFPHGVRTVAGLVTEENGFVFLVKELKETMKRIEEEGVIHGAKQMLGEFMKPERGFADRIGVAGANRFEVYGTDFGWGRPEMVEVTSVDRTGSFSMAETKHGNGVEIGLALTENQMDIFSSLFVNGLK